MNIVLHHIKYTKLLESLLQQPTNHFRQVLVGACIKIFTADCLGGHITIGIDSSNNAMIIIQLTIDQLA